MRINHNIAALNTYRQLTIGQNAAAKNMEKLSSGLRINRAGDDAAGLAISEKMRGQIRGLEQASRNSQDAISLIQTAEGALNETHSILQRMRELAVQAANDTNTDDDRKELQKEINELVDEIDRIADQTEFNTQKLLDGNGNFTFHIGANSGQTITLNISDMNADSIGTPASGSGGGIASGKSIRDLKNIALSTSGSGNVGVMTQSGAEQAITIIDDAIKMVSAERSKLGAYQNRLEHTINNLGTAAENLTAAESRIRDVDMAKEMMEFTKNNILTQAAQAMLAQANQQPQGVLQLLR
ncbi:flagellin protein [Geobacillus kaustophilus HTA426]|uniref:Flagellin n=1 Tax=Geobacillus kaustophilus (strain HTA426) TaxID=235909 RepID=Q5KV70_GEOKA|nr:flagellin Hag [Geobacillus kaustophilus]MED4971639.1 flagellin Hag [Geobacillus thermoleovorans]QCK81074.1 flagellin [Geobacillus kaustophilus NBRC 102445]WJQ13754.1 flagellin Hag [Geobacillus stearothermophilus]BAD77416.1 flagellin protein [Geobacillus kaustophilus HTA426]